MPTMRRQVVLEDYARTKNAFMKKNALVEITGHDGLRYSLIFDLSTTEHQGVTIDHVAYLVQFLMAKHIAGVYIDPEGRRSLSNNNAVLFDYSHQGLLQTDLCEIHTSKVGRVKRIAPPVKAQLNQFLFQNIYQHTVLNYANVQRAMMPIVDQCIQSTRRSIH